MAPIRVGIIGLRAMPEDLSAVMQVGYWAAIAHLPALKALPEDYEIVAVCNSSVESATKAIKQYGLSESTKAYGNAQDLANDPNVELVVISVKVGKHFELAKPALEKKKHVFVEWPLGASIAEAEELSRLAKTAGVRTSVGVQGRADPLVVKIKSIIASGQIGKIVNSSVLVSSGHLSYLKWMEGAEYFVEHKSGATVFSIYLGHFLDSFTHVLGDFSEVQAIMKSTIPSISVLNAKGTVVNPAYPKTAADQVVVQGILESDALVSISLRHPGADADGASFRWIISGTEGEIEVIVPQSGWQMGEPKRTLKLKTGADEAQEVDFLAEDELEGKVPAVSANVARQYRAFAKGDTEAAATFESALKNHRLLDRIVRAAGWESV
ncbi:oxidoreductase [Nemania sp. NC0429]|nr:oxidoreductase [Nemania sp. NC0429]